jgi:hypothetical protein
MASWAWVQAIPIAIEASDGRLISQCITLSVSLNELGDNTG